MLKIDTFGGAVPLVSDRLLPNNMASVAVNVDLVSGEIRPLRRPQTIFSFSQVGDLTTEGGDPITTEDDTVIQTAPFGQGTARAHRIPSPDPSQPPTWINLESIHARVFRPTLVNDSFERFVKIDNNAPGTAVLLQQNSLARIQTNAPWLLLGVPPPASAPVVGTTGGSAPDVTRAYTYTYVNIFGEESAPAPPTLFDGPPDATWNITGLAAPSSTVISERGIAQIRIYRTVTGSTGTLFYRVATQDVSNSSYADTRPDLELTFEAILLQSTTWRVPELAEGLIAMPNGFFAAWRGRDVFFSEPYRAWAWPTDYIVSVPDPIVGCGVLGQTLVVLTESVPVLIGGPRPDSMTVERLDFVEPCVAPESVFSAPEGVYFASKRGLMLISPGGPINITGRLISPGEWSRSFAPRYVSTLVTANQIFGFEKGGNGFVLDKDEARAGLTFVRNDVNYNMVWMDPYTGEIHGSAGSTIRLLFNESVGASGGWRSKEFMFPAPVNLGAVVVYLESDYDADGVCMTRTPLVPVDGGPWTDQSTVLNYNLLNTLPLNTSPEPGTLPPTTDPNAVGVSGWPQWYGLIAVDIATADLTGSTLEVGAHTYLVVRADGKVVWERAVSDKVVYRLPSGLKATLWQVDIVTRVPVYSIQLAETGKDLARV